MIFESILVVTFALILDLLVGDPKNRFKNLAPGEVVVGSPKTGSKIHFKANGDIDIESDGVVTLNGSSEPLVRGNALKIYNDGHVHPDPVSGVTGPPSVPMPTKPFGCIANLSSPEV